MTVDAATLEAALRAAVPAAVADRVPAVAAVVAGLAAGMMQPDQARAELAQDGALLDALAHRSVNAGQSLVDFAGAVAGQVTVGDVAGGDIYNVTVNLGPATVRIGERTELFEVESAMVRVLNEGHVDEHTLEYAAEAIGLTLSGSLEDKRWALAAKLLRTDLASLVQAAHRLSPQLCDQAGTLVTTAAPFMCVDRAAVPLIRQAVTTAPVRRGLGLNSSTSRTGFMYVDAACPTNPRWGSAEVPGGWGNWAELEASVAAAVKEALGFLPEDDLAEVQRSLQDSAAVLVFTDPALPTADDVRDLRSKGYGAVSFFLLAGDTSQAAFTAMGFEGIDFLPELDRARENLDHDTVQGAVRAARRACAQRSR